MKDYLLTVLCAAGLALSALGQSDYSVRLQSGPVGTSDFLEPNNGHMLHYEISAHLGFYYLIIQFQDIPSEEKKRYLKSLGVVLYDYLPNYAFLAKVPETLDPGALKARAVIPFRAKYKLAASIASESYPDHALKNGRLHLNVYTYQEVKPQELLDHLLQKGYSSAVLRQGKVFLQIAPMSIDDLAKLPLVKYLEPIEAPPVPEGTRGRTLQRLNTLSQEPGQGYDGLGVSISIADDGSIDHVDFTNRVSDHTSSDSGDHGDMVCGLAVGSGNIDPTAMGMAPAAWLHLFDINGYPHITQAETYSLEHGVVITSTSYGEGCGGLYSQSASSIDDQVHANEELLHCFSTGNNASESCGIYGGISTPQGIRFGNITGGRKSAKNVIAVANLLYNDSLKSSSSRGPALDGRIKPDISTHGQGNRTTDTGNTYREGGGTSAASPTLAGTAAALYQAYRELTGEANPSSALIKALMLNTAEDLGRPGPDYDFGWGRVHAGRALRCIENGQYFQAGIQHGQQQEHLIQIPANVKELKVMVYWNDPAGSPFAEKALVNDLDIKLNLPNGSVQYPWVLSTAAVLDSLIKPAYPGIDHINNMEQISIQNPAPGTYTLEVEGFLIPEGPQTYQVVYYFEEQEMAITYPAGGEGLVPGETQVIRWDASGQMGNFSLEYSLDDGNSWQVIQNNIDGSLRFYDWTVPNMATGSALIRVKRNELIATSPATFSIIGIPDFDIEFLNNSTAIMSWDPINGANEYDIYALGDQHMEIIGTSNDNNFLIPMGLWESNWFSIRAKNTDGATGRRAYAMKYTQTPCDTEISIFFQFDLYPQETSWSIINSQGLMMVSGGPYNEQSPNSSLTVQACLPYDCYYFIIQDGYGDGICCQNGDGYYEILDDDANVLATGGAFNSAQVKSFCLNPPVEALNVQVINISDVSCSGGDDGWIALNASGGTGIYQYTWQNGDQGNLAENLEAGYYTVTVSDAEESVIAGYTIGEPEPLQLTIETSGANCDGNTNTSLLGIPAGGTTPYNFTWSNASQEAAIDQLSAGTYSLVVIDAMGCSTSASETIEETAVLPVSINKTDVSCYGGEDGSAEAFVGGSIGDFQYEWSNGETSNTIEGLAAGEYSLSISDGNGCSAIREITIQQPPEIHQSADTTEPGCHNGSDGSIALNVNGGVSPYQVSWENGQEGLFIEHLAAGSYAFTLTDQNNCVFYEEVLISEPSALILNIDTGVPEYNGDGTIDLTVSGGTAPYTYNWSTGDNTQDLNSLYPGDYFVTVFDAHDCSKSISVNIPSIPQGTVYCESSGSNTSFEWINWISIGGFSHQSGNNGGYADFTSLTIPLTVNTDYALQLQPGFSSATFNEKWRVWLDINQDGDFSDAGELLVSTSSSGTINTPIYLPMDTPSGETRMRIAMKYGGYPPECGVFAYGEVEEYTVSIEGSAAIQEEIELFNTDASPASEFQSHFIEETDFKIYPNPSRGWFSMDWKMKEAKLIRVVNSQGLTVLEQAIHHYEYHQDLDISHFAAGQYYVQLFGGSQKIVRQIIIM